MCSKMISAARVLVLVGVATATGTGVLLAQATTRVSVDSHGGEANSASMEAGVSADGRFVVFASDADDLVSGDANYSRDVFLHDRLDGRTIRVSVNSLGEQANSDSWLSSISADGGIVVFVSSATNLDAAATNGLLQVFVHDVLTGNTELVSINSQGEPGDANSPDFPYSRPVTSQDGRLVAFMSLATNLVSTDTNGVADIFVHDRLTHQTERVSVDSRDAQADAWSLDPAISADGRFVAFASDATNLVIGDTNTMSDVFVRDRQIGETTRVSVDSQGREGTYWWGGGCGGPTLSSDGREVAFYSSVWDLAPDTNGGDYDIFVHDCVSGETTIVSVDSEGRQGYNCGGTYLGRLSGDGRYVAFTSSCPFVSDDTWMGNADVFVHDRETGATTRASVDSQGNEGDAQSGLWAGPAISFDGQIVVFESFASNLVAGDTNLVADIFVRDRKPGPCTFPASWTNYGSGWPGTNGVPGLFATSNPVLCTTLSVTANNSSGVDTTGVLLAGFNSANWVTAWGGTVLVLPLLASNVLVPAAGLSVSAPIPCDDSLCGLALYVQVVEMDPGASHGVSFTPGLELRLGVQ